METSARIAFIQDRSYRIRHAAEAINPLPGAYHQAIRVIREEGDLIEMALTGEQ
jgi:hypothetical protein